MTKSITDGELIILGFATVLSSLGGADARHLLVALLTGDDSPLSDKCVESIKPGVIAEYVTDWLNQWMSAEP